VLCPTQWTVWANALASIIENYVVLQETWDEALEVAKDTDSKAKINEVSAQMKKFEFLFLVNAFASLQQLSPNIAS